MTVSSPDPFPTLAGFVRLSAVCYGWARYVSGNLFIYHEEGNPQAVVAPDGCVVFAAFLPL